MKTRSVLRRRDFMKGLASAGIVSSLGYMQAGRANPFFAQNNNYPESAVNIEDWNPVRHLTPVRPDNLLIRAAVGTTDVGNGETGSAWLLNDALPSPFIRVRRGERFRARLENDLPDSLILHWHGLTPPELMDGHPRLAIDPGTAYDYDFTVENRAGTYWYHSHTHHRVGKHTYFGIAGMLIVDDEEADALDLPSGEYEIPLVLQDRRFDFSGSIIPYSVPDTMEGFIGNEPFGNGVNRPELEVDTALYRFRILNGSNARIFRLARNDRAKLYIIGNDAGFLEKTEAVDYADIAPGERLDVLIDLRDAEVGQHVLLGSRAFFIKDGLAHEDDINRQGYPMDLMRLRVTRKIRDRHRIPEKLVTVKGPDPKDAVRERPFALSSGTDGMTRTMMRHTINGKTFRFGDIHETVPFGETEIWTFKNENQFSHPMHLHATHFRVLSRSGGRGRVMPWEKGLKDTVLVHPGEEVKVAVRFDAHPGLFLLHCHNLEHEDTGMMMNIMVQA